jgi:IclR family transcriptional regulator, KDG regulon repressor
LLNIVVQYATVAEIQSLTRGLHILDLLSQSVEGASVTEMAAALGVDKASASRLASTLAHNGYVERDESTRRYHLGPRVVTLSRSVLSRLPWREAAKPFLRQLMERTGECAHLAVASQGKALYVDQVESPATLRVNVQVGQTGPLHCTALGKVLLAFTDLPIPAKLESYTQRTITDRAVLERSLGAVRRLGYAVDDEEFDTGVRCIAVPVVDFRGKVVGSVGISGPATRVTRKRLPTLAGIVVEVGLALGERQASGNQ